MRRIQEYQKNPNISIVTEAKNYPCCYGKTYELHKMETCKQCGLRYNCKIKMK
jgi:hypothetical protein